MRKLTIAMATTLGIAVAAPTIGQAQVPELDPQAAVECSVVADFVGDVAKEGGDPQASARLKGIAAAWRYLGFERMDIDEATYNAKIANLKGALVSALKSIQDDDQVREMMEDAMTKCDDLASAHLSELEGATAALKAKK